mmetsp:Transcript_86373/g.200875  ORF Transcript_86373/g.200875 Transcript_86373/m.200875 type:complete len:281 (+) Transcript_86373:780-1622(+)
MIEPLFDHAHAKAREIRCAPRHEGLQPDRGVCVAHSRLCTRRFVLREGQEPLNPITPDFADDVITNGDHCVHQAAECEGEAEHVEQRDTAFTPSFFKEAQGAPHTREPRTTDAKLQAVHLPYVLVELLLLLLKLLLRAPRCASLFNICISFDRECLFTLRLEGLCGAVAGLPKTHIQEGLVGGHLLLSAADLLQLSHAFVQGVQVVQCLPEEGARIRQHLAPVRFLGLVLLDHVGNLLLLINPRLRILDCLDHGVNGSSSRDATQHRQSDRVKKGRLDQS